MTSGVCWLHDGKARNRELTGGKASNLARLLDAGFPVPRGFVIPVGIHRNASESWTRAFHRASHRLEAPLAVRSSMVGEDDLHQSFAGQLETVLNVRHGEELLSAVEKVRSSVERPELNAYLQQTHFSEPLKLAVLVQEMVPARAAGVAFSADPITGRSSVVIEAVPHLGEELVRGRAEPDRFVVDPRGNLTEENRKCLPPDEFPSDVVTRLAEMVRRAAAHFGVPQDVEWAWDGQTLSILQARPITTLVGKNVYSRKLVGDMTPGPISHLVWSTNTVGMVESVFGEVFTRLIGKNDYDFTRILRRIRSRAYVNTTFVGELLAEVGLPRNLFEAIAREEKVPRRIRLNRKLLSRLPGIISMVWRYGRLERELERVLDRHDEALDAFRRNRNPEAPAPVLLHRVQELLAHHRSLQRCIMFGSMNLAIRTRLLKRFVARHAPEVDPSDLLLGLRGLKSLEPNRELQAIATRAGSLEPELVELLLTGHNQTIRVRLSESAQGGRLLGEVEAFLARFGFLSANGTNFGEPTWAEESGPLWRALGRMIHNETPPPSDPGPVREAARQSVLSRLGPLEKRRFLRRLASSARYLELRERISLLMTEDTFHLRWLFLGIGEHLKRAGEIPHSGDVFLLTHPELIHAVESPDRHLDLQGLVEARKKEIEEDRDIEPPETILGEEIPSDTLNEEAGPLLTGIGVSAGVIQGTARVVRKLDSAPGHLTRDDILIVPFSDVGWTPLFATVGGVVAECGGQLSHTAIVAREYGLPAVVGVRGAMKRIREGQKITVDGASGRVLISQTEPQAPPSRP